MVAQPLLAAAALALSLCALVPAGSAGPLRPQPAHTGASLLERVAVFGPDDRIRLPERYRGLHNSIGLLYHERSKTVCSAFCVADNVIATAGHCIYRTAGETPPRAEGFVFSRPGSRRPVVQIAGYAQRAATQHVLGGTTDISVRPPIDAARDWALVRLETPACASNVLAVQPMAPDMIAARSRFQQLYQVGFHRDFGNWTLAYSQPCEAGVDPAQTSPTSIARDFRAPEHLILHTCDTGGASSGSPLLIDGPRGPQVVGINVGTYVQAQVMIDDSTVVQRYNSHAVANTAVGAEAFAGRIAAFQAASILTSPDDIKSLQAGLAAMRLYAGDRDGGYGPRLREAIMRLERREGAPVTGLPTADLLRRLEAWRR